MYDSINLSVCQDSGPHMYIGPLRDEIISGVPTCPESYSAVVFHWHLPVATCESICFVVDDVIHVIWLMLLFLYFLSRLKSIYGIKIIICQLEVAFKIKIDSISFLFHCNIDDWDCISLMLVILIPTILLYSSH